jgi:tetratricopeptide (TPR) repeat protein
MAAGQFARAVERFERSLDADPDDPSALFQLAWAERAAGRPHAARVAVEQLLALEPECPEVLHLAADLRWTTGDVAGTLAATEALLALQDVPSAHGLRGLALQRLAGREAEAIASLQAGGRAEPADWPLPLPVADDDWPELLAVALHQTEPAVQSFWADLPVRFEDWPEARDIGPTGRVGPEASVVGTEADAPHGTPVSVLRVFRRNAERALDRARLVAQLAEALSLEAEVYRPPEP